MGSRLPRVRFAFFVGLFFIAVGLTTVLLPSDSAQAAPCAPGRTYCNSDEGRAYSICAPRGNVPQGAIWFNNTSDASTTDGYYALGVNIAANAEFVQVNIRGSVYSCGQRETGNVFAINVSPNTDGGRLPLSSRLSSLSSSVLNRGTYNNQLRNWTSQGGTISATLDVRGLAMNNVNGSNTETITVGLYRCYSTDGVSSVGGAAACNISDVPVVITRAQEPKFTLTPIVTVDKRNGSVAEPVTASPSVSSSGASNAVSNTAWQLSRFVAPPSGGYPTTLGINGNAPAAHYGNGLTSVRTGTNNFGVGITNLDTYGENIADVPVGSRICYALSVRPYTNNNTANEWAHSAPACVVVAKSPKVQIRGNDLVVGRGLLNLTTSPQITTSRTTLASPPSGANGTVFGSWSEYGIVAKGRVTGMASGSGYVGGAESGVLCPVSLLTFTNPGPSPAGGCSADSVGGYPLSGPVSSVVSRFPATSATQTVGGSVNITGMNLQGFYKTSGPIQLSSSSALPLGKWVVINAGNEDVTITGNINYSNGAMTKITDIPQVIIIARNIIISDAVTNIDAWLVATGSDLQGRINTCGAGGVNEMTVLNSNTCDDTLTVNGPVIANRLLLRRTAGTGTGNQAGSPAEIFNLRPDAYLWAIGYLQGNGRIPTVTTKELPPKF